MSTRIRIKRGIESQITGYTGPHYEGELAYATDTGNVFVSDGTAFINIGVGTLDSVTSAGNTTANSIEVGSVTANGNFLITGTDSTVELRGASVDFNIQTTDAENIARIATTTGGTARFQLYNHTEGFEGAEEFKATTWEDDALVISGGIPTTTKLLVSRNPNEATLQVTGDASISGDIILTSPNDTAYRIVVGNTGTLAAIPPSSFAPSITTLPTISGILNVGETLTATAGTTSGEPTPTQSFQWQRSDNGTTGWADISGATGTTYLLAFNDEDKYIRVAQTEENILGTATANSASTTQIGPAAFVGLLDDYPNAAAAYSLRKLSLNYSGDAIIVRRTSDNATQSIGFVNNELDTASLESFCAGTDGFVTTWFDQSGNGNDAAQTTSSAQPKIVSSGSTILDNGKAALEFDSDVLQSSSLFKSNYISYVSTDSANTLSQRFNPTEQQYNWGLAEIGSSKSIVIYNPSFSYYTSTDAYSNTQSLNTIQSEDVELFKNGSSILDTGQNVVLGASPNTEKLNIGAYGANGVYSYFGGKFQEVIVYDTDQSTNRTGIETNINDHYSIY